MGATGALAQDDAGMQAMQQSQQAAQQAMQQTQQANQQMTEQMMQGANTPPAVGCCFPTAKPTFSVRPGKYAGAQIVKIRDTTWGAVIYYTTDGWTPTTDSTRYKGPITIDSTMTLEAIAVSPYTVRSLVANAQYTIIGSHPTPVQAAATDEVAPSIVDGSALLPEGMPVHLVFATDVDSKTADVGDKIALTLAEDIKAGDAVVVPRGAQALGTVIQVDKNGIGGRPGNIVFEVQSLNVNGHMVRLRGAATLEGQPKPPNAALLIPVVGGLTIFRHGKNAEIKPGTPVTAYVDADTSIMLVSSVNPPVL